MECEEHAAKAHPIHVDGYDSCSASRFGHDLALSVRHRGTAVPLVRIGHRLVLAGMVARGTTNVLRVYHLDRGYENPPS